MNLPNYVNDKKKNKLIDLCDEISEIEFQNVCFGYREGENIIDNFSLKIRKGEK